jgi:hypothetical protein
LADVLEEAGLTDASLLGHLRGPGAHVRGCWAIDLLLGKEYAVTKQGWLCCTEPCVLKPDVRR